MKNGFSLVEILMAVALSAVFIPALVHIYSLSIFSTSQGEKFSQGTALAQEQMEAVYFVKNNDLVNWDWVTTPSNTAVDEYYQLQQTGDVWVLGDKNPVLSGEYSKKVEIKEVRRDPGNQSVTDNTFAPVDDFSRFVKVVVSWSERGEEQAVVLESLVTQR